MISLDNGIGNPKDEIEESNVSEVKEFASIDISTTDKTFLSSEDPQSKLQGTLSSSVPNRIKFLKFGSASAKFKRLATERDQVSLSVPSRPKSLKARFSGLFAQKLDGGSVKKMCMEWIRSPVNMALFMWITCVAVSGAILFLVMTGMLNGVIPRKSQRNAWFEVNNQILNALFTLMCLYQHPKRFYHLVLLIRWRPNDISRLRKVYCKNGTYKPHECAHMMVVIILLHVNCFAQYALCGLNIGYKRSERPAIGVGICITFAIAAPAVAGMYTILSPLGKDYDCEIDEEAQLQITASQRQEQLREKPFEKKYSFASKNEQRVVENRPNWSGGVLDIWNDISLAYLSLFCTFCVKEIDTDEQPSISPLAREDVVSTKTGPSSPMGSNTSYMIKTSSPSNSSNVLKGYYSPDRVLCTVKEDNCERGKDGIMKPPVPSRIQRETP
uniref:PLAC8 family protein n=1 Tax=Cajanus cajan TaxID=3821 RepID=A0A151RQW6_CAJCA|nr:hypothetical protein KK1_033520 [Cajanus cajan]